MSTRQGQAYRRPNTFARDIAVGTSIGVIATCRIQQRNASSDNSISEPRNSFASSAAATVASVRTIVLASCVVQNGKQLHDVGVYAAEARGDAQPIFAHAAQCQSMNAIHGKRYCWRIVSSNCLVIKGSFSLFLSRLSDARKRYSSSKLPTVKSAATPSASGPTGTRIARRPGGQDVNVPVPDGHGFLTLQTMQLEGGFE